MENLLDETLEVMEKYGYKPPQVSWVGSSDGRYAISMKQFQENFDQVNYDAGFGGQRIAADLVVKFRDGSWLERQEYDGAEWWCYRKTPNRSISPLPFQFITDNDNATGWEDTIAAFNGADVD